MFHKSLDPNRTPETPPLRDRRSLTDAFVFLTQDDSVRFTADSCAHVLHRANHLLGRDLYSWSHLNADALDLDATQICDPNQTLVLIGGSDTPWRPDAAQLRFLRSAIRSAARVCVVGSAVFVPLAAGVLGAKKLSVHADFQPGVLETCTGVELHAASTCHHKALSSATGPAAAMRMMIELVGAREGDFAQSALARDLGLTEETSPDTGSGEHWRLQRQAQGCDVISDALQIMEDHLEDTLSVAQIADIVGVSPRKLERSFSDRLARSPLKVYRDLRLDRAHALMIQTAMPLGEVSIACGFSNVTLMKRWFHHKYGQAPQEVRRQAFKGLCPS